MKNIFVLLLFFIPFSGIAQVLDADAVLDKAVAVMNADAPLQMDYSYTVYDEDNSVVVKDNGIMRLDGERYSVVMDKMGVWCDGETQWSYMLEIDEIYITDSSSGEAQNLSPLYIMENYRKGCTKDVKLHDDNLFVTLHAPAGSEFEKVVLCIDALSYRLESMKVFTPNQGYIEIILDKYQIKCNFASDVYKCPVEEYETAEIVDMR